MIAEIKHTPGSPLHKVFLDEEQVAVYFTRKSALKLVNSFLKADFTRMDLHTEGHARLWKHFDR